MIIMLGRRIMIWFMKEGCGFIVMVYLYMHGVLVFFFWEHASVKGRLLKINECLIDKLGLNYARNLITTKLVGKINEVEDFWVDGKKYPIRFVEDLEFRLTDDACLIEFE